jgi:hypothetical protein
VTRGPAQRCPCCCELLDLCVARFDSIFGAVALLYCSLFYRDSVPLYLVHAGGGCLYIAVVCFRVFYRALVFPRPAVICFLEAKVCLWQRFACWLVLPFFTSEGVILLFFT